MAMSLPHRALHPAIKTKTWSASKAPKTQKHWKSCQQICIYTETYTYESVCVCLWIQKEVIQFVRGKYKTLLLYKRISVFYWHSLANAAPLAPFPTIHHIPKQIFHFHTMHVVNNIFGFLKLSQCNVWAWPQLKYAMQCSILMSSTAKNKFYIHFICYAADNLKWKWKFSWQK